MGKLHASLTPNVANAGETLTVEFDGSDDADELIVQIFEVDDASPFEPAGRDKLLVTFHGKLAANKFSLTPPPDGGANPNIPPVGDPSAPKITIDAGGNKAQISLPDAQVEQGMFELRLVVQSKKPKKAKFTSPDIALVRAFRHFMVNNVPRPVVAFVTGAESDNFFQAATEFWKVNADVLLVKKDMSLAEILDVLDSQGQKFGPWGQINIVAHGREHLVKMRLFPDSPQTSLHVDGMTADIAAHTKPLASPSSIDDETEVVFRACNAGRDQDLVDAIKSSVFPSAKFVKIPRFPQFYEFTKTTSSTLVSEHFDDLLIFDRRTKGLALGDLTAGLRASFDERSGKTSGAADSPGLSPAAKPDVEIPTFDQAHDFELPLGDFDEEEPEEKITLPSGAPMTNTDIAAFLAANWNNFQPPLDQSTQTWKTEANRWVLQIVSKTEDTKAAEDVKGVFLRVTTGTGTPNFQQIGSGGIGIGTRTGDDTVWTVSAKGVADLHAVVNLNQSTLNQVEVQDANSGSPTVVSDAKGTKTLNAAAKQVVTLPATITMGQAVVAMRRGKAFDVKFNGTRFFIDRRRVMRTFDASQPYAKRSIVVPDLTNPLHYGTSQ